MDEELPSLDDILALGGTKDDLELFKGNTKGTIDSDVLPGEVSEFIKTIGLTPELVMETTAPAENNGLERTGKKKKEVKSKKHNVLEENDGKKNGLKCKEDKESIKPKKPKDNKKRVHKRDEGSNHSVGSAEISKKTEDHKKRKRKISEKNTSAGIPPTYSPPQQEIQLLTPEVERRLLALNYTEHKTILIPLADEGDIQQWFDHPKVLNEIDALNKLKEVMSIPSAISGIVATDKGYSAKLLAHLNDMAKSVMKTELALYKKVREQTRKKDVQWLRTVLTSGTLNDKMAALTLIVQESPVHTLPTVDQFLNMAAKKGKRESLLAIDTFKDLLLSDLLPESRKLRLMSQRPLEDLLMDKDKCDYQRLVLWYYEGQLKERYGQFIAILAKLLHDPVAQIREKVLGVIFDLLYKKPEQEQQLLQSVVNKMGDPNRRIASKCILLLLKLLNHHVNMKSIVVQEVELFLCRPNLSEKAQYYAICFLNQVVISPKDQSLAYKLASVYFSFFKMYTSKGTFEAKILSALLTGVNRALPFLKNDIPSFEEHLNSLFKIVHIGPLATGIQSLVLLYQVMESRQAVSARYYRSLYEKLLDPKISHSTTQQAMFLNILFKSLKNDPEFNRVKAFLKRILQSCSYHNPHFICGCLVLISEVLKHKTSLWPYVIRSEGEEKECFEDVADSSEVEEEDMDMDDNEPSAEEDHQVPENVLLAYSVDKREPMYCKAETSCLWELSKMSLHYHPTVQFFAKKMLQGEHIDYSGDPLNDFTLLRFLDQFAHKNPKQSRGDKGGSLMQPTSNLISSKPYSLPMSINELASMDEERVREDLRFIHQFMKRDRDLHQGKYNKKTASKNTKVARDEVLSSENEEEPDFAGQMKKAVQTKESKKKNKRSRSSDSDSDSNDDDSTGEHSYTELIEDGFSDEDDYDMAANDKGQSGKKRKRNEMNEAELENLLLDNLTDSDDSDTDVVDNSNKRSKNKKYNKGGGDREKKSRQPQKEQSVFESADKFVHLLKEQGKDTSHKQLEWEANRSSGRRRGQGRRGRPNTRRK